MQGTVGSGLCYVGMSWCVRKRGPLFTATFSSLVQIMEAMFDIPILHEQEQLHLGSLLGSIIVIAEVYILLWGKNKELTPKYPKKLKGFKDQDPMLQFIAVSNWDSWHHLLHAKLICVFDPHKNSCVGLSISIVVIS
ncbi:WAT1-related protein At3g30340-like [Actinidia eriantha]|uniref:WAT1-related protein At3g30340-like n=1 Tax=Actinidia eriantha TaxID=165200 RepID=UPI002583DF05|nr:WAT1-related protein At3g30340-like [Actinidia eriantha]